MRTCSKLFVSSTYIESFIHIRHTNSFVRPLYFLRYTYQSCSLAWARLGACICTVLTDEGQYYTPGLRVFCRGLLCCCGVGATIDACTHWQSQPYVYSPRNVNLHAIWSHQNPNVVAKVDIPTSSIKENHSSLTQLEIA